MSVIRAEAITMGKSSRATVSVDADSGEDGYYRWRKMPGWVPNDPRCYPDKGDSPAVPHPANVKAVAGRAARLQEFGRLLTAEGLSVQEAAERMGIGISTARQYKRDLEQPRGDDPDD